MTDTDSPETTTVDTGGHTFEVRTSLPERGVELLQPIVTHRDRPGEVVDDLARLAATVCVDSTTEPDVTDPAEWRAAARDLGSPAEFRDAVVDTLAAPAIDDYLDGDPADQLAAFADSMAGPPAPDSEATPSERKFRRARHFRQ